MKSVLLIGLGRFGKSVAEKLNELHHQVMAVDKVEEKVNDVLPLVTDAQIGDATNETFPILSRCSYPRTASSPSGKTSRVPSKRHPC